MKLISSIVGMLLLVSIFSHEAAAQNNMLQLKDTARGEYPYRFPILGAAAYEKGFNLPLPAGIMVNTFVGVQDILIPDISVGFSDGIIEDIPLTDITRLIEFEEIEATALSVNVRPDLWVFPFLNVYGIFGRTWATTDVKITYPFEFSTQANLQGTSYGLGINGASGLGKYFFVLDGNWLWTDMTNFAEPVLTRTFSFRVGRAFHIFKNPESNVAFWAGGMRIRMGGITDGVITMNEILPSGSSDTRDQVVNDYYLWYNDIDPLKQAAADRVLTPIVESIASADGDGQIQYQITKKPKREWNIIVGGQYQINQRYQIRAEGGIIGNRKSFLLSGNYRFGI